MKLYEESLTVLEDTKEEMKGTIQSRFIEIEATLGKWRVEAGSLAEEAKRKMDHYISILERKLNRQKQKIKEMTVSSDTWEDTKKEMKILSEEIDELYEEMKSYFQSSGRKQK